ncbi:hypothetical protein DR64_313 [Paraburkholderia xenovorans LB400]|jgi:hypothetical protein|nr:hypothetical protein DR64_313 [Paraburkholderia xenovorans LB400]
MMDGAWMDSESAYAVRRITEVQTKTALAVFDCP